MNIEPSNFVVRGKQELAVPKDAKELVFDALVLVAGSHLKVS